MLVFSIDRCDATPPASDTRPEVAIGGEPESDGERHLRGDQDL